MEGVSSSGGRAMLFLKQQHSLLPLQIGFGFFSPMVQHTPPSLQSMSSVTTGLARMHSMGFSPTLQQNSSLRQQHSFMPEQPMTLAKSKEIMALQQQHAVNTRSSPLEEKIDMIGS